jgi:hypothetical protein
MKKNCTRLFLYLILFTILGVATSPPVRGQTGPVAVRPTALYRFEVSYWDGGHLLTGIYQEGVANGYSFDPFNYPSFDGLGIYVPPPGYTPDPSVGLVPLHRWTVIQDGWRTHYYYSTYYTEQPPDRYYNGIAGWVFPPGQLTTGPGFGIGQPLALHQLSVYYSTDLGFWNGYGGTGVGYNEPPPDRDGKSPYGFQGIICALPPSMADPQFPPGSTVSGVYDVTFYPPGGGGSSGGGGGGGGGSCNPSSGTVNACQHNGGWWDYDTCTCQY